MSAMRSNITRSIVVVVMVVIGLILSPGVTSRADGQLRPELAVGGDDTPNCATHGEYDRIDVFMQPETVAGIVGNNGWFIDTVNPDTFARGYRSCWAPGVRYVKVWYDLPSHLSFRKDVLDV